MEHITRKLKKDLENYIILTTPTRDYNHIIGNLREDKYNRKRWFNEFMLNTYITFDKKNSSKTTKPRYKTKTYTEEESRSIWALASELELRCENPIEEFDIISNLTFHPIYNLDGSMNYDGMVRIASEAMINPRYVEMAAKQIISQNTNRVNNKNNLLTKVSSKTKRFCKSLRKVVSRIPYRIVAVNN